MTTVADVLRVASEEVGTAEKPVNKTKYGVWYGMDGVYWCAIFVSWVFAHAGMPLPQIDSPKGFASTPDGVAWFKRRGRWHGPNDLKPGDIIFFNFDTDPGPEHVGIVEKVLGPGKYQTIEGNTSSTDAGSQRNGGGVYRRVRQGSCVLGGGRLDFAPAKPTPPPAVPTGVPGHDHRAPVLKAGSTDPATNDLQGHLNAAYAVHPEIAPLEITGVMDERTVIRLRDWEHRTGLKVDGIVDATTWARLHEVTNGRRIDNHGREF